MSLWRVTFGQKFASNVHPLFPDAHPDGWVGIEATDESQAHLLAFAALGRGWSFVYRNDMPGRFAEHSYPRGCLGWIVSRRGYGAMVVPRSERHGHIEPREDNMLAKCMGPAGCDVCHLEQLTTEATAYNFGEHAGRKGGGDVHASD